MISVKWLVGLLLQQCVTMHHMVNVEVLQVTIAGYVINIFTDDSLYVILIQSFRVCILTNENNKTVESLFLHS